MLLMQLLFLSELIVKLLTTPSLDVAPEAWNEQNKTEIIRTAQFEIQWWVFKRQTKKRKVNSVCGMRLLLVLVFNFCIYLELYVLI